MQGCDPLEWWKVQTNIFPILSWLVIKYLSIPTTFVLSKRLFFDASFHLSSRHTCLKSKLLGSMLFLKYNIKLFDIFKPKDK